MNGSQKQIKWAEDIKASKDFSKFLGKGRNEQANAIIAKAVSFIESNDNAAFWIEYQDSSEMEMLNGLMTSGLLVKGWQFDHRATMAQDGTITITWEEIVQDGKGGHKETRTRII